jgi:hypothetical protein
MSLFILTTFARVGHANGPMLTNHILQAVSGALVVLGFALMIAAFIWFPPFEIAAIAGGGSELVWTLTVELAKTAAMGGLLTTTGATMLNNATDNPTPTGGQGGGTHPSEQPEKPASPNKITSGKRANKVAQDVGYDGAEDLKKEFVGKKDGSRWDMFIDRATREIWLGTKDQGTWVPTGLFSN